MLELLLQRLFEQKVHAALEKLLSPANTLMISVMGAGGAANMAKGPSTTAQAAAAAAATNLSQSRWGTRHVRWSATSWSIQVERLVLSVAVLLLEHEGTHNGLKPDSDMNC